MAMAEWEFSLWFSMPGKDELIATTWKPALADGLDAEECARKVADEIFTAPNLFISCLTEDGHRYVIPINQIQWVRVMTREKEQSNAP